MQGRYPEVIGVDVIRAHALGLVDAARRVPLDTPVVTCPGWSMADLVWHLTEVHLFWTHVIHHRPADPDSFAEPARPPDGELTDALERAAEGLVAELDDADPDDAAWSWADDHSVGFTLRRQSHEAVVHHVDGRLAAALALPAIPPRLAADGIDEMFGVMLTGIPDWARFERRPGVVELRTLDTDDVWTMVFGRMLGTSPESGTEYDLGALEPVAESPDAVLAGEALDLHLWLCGRGDLGSLQIEGDERLAHELRLLAASL